MGATTRRSMFVAETTYKNKYPPYATFLRRTDKMCKEGLSNSLKSQPAALSQTRYMKGIYRLGAESTVCTDNKYRSSNWLEHPTGRLRVQILPILLYLRIAGMVEW